MAVRIGSLLISIGFTALVLMVTGCSSHWSRLTNHVRGDGLEKRAFFHRVWAKDLDPSAQKTGNLPIATLSPAIHKGFLFQGSLSGDFYAFSLESGHIAWSAKQEEAISSKASIWKDLVLYGDRAGRIYARHLFTGKLAYSFDVGSPLEGEVIFDGQRAFIHTRSHSVVSFDGATGKTLWSYKRSIPYGTTLQGVSNPLVMKGRLLMGFADGFMVALSGEDGQIIWERKISSGAKFVDVDMNPKIDGRRGLYVGAHEGQFVRLDPDTGRIIQRFDFTASAPPLFFQDKIFVGTVTGELRVLGRKEGRALKKIVLNGYSPITGVYLWKDFVVVTDTMGKLYQIQPQKIMVEEEVHLGHDFSAIYGDLAIWEEYLAVSSSRSRLYVFR